MRKEKIINVDFYID